MYPKRTVFFLFTISGDGFGSIFIQLALLNTSFLAASESHANRFSSFFDSWPEAQSQWSQFQKIREAPEEIISTPVSSSIWQDTYIKHTKSPPDQSKIISLKQSRNRTFHLIIRNCIFYLKKKRSFPNSFKHNDKNTIIFNIFRYDRMQVKSAKKKN